MVETPTYRVRVAGRPIWYYGPENGSENDYGWKAADKSNPDKKLFGAKSRINGAVAMATEDYGANRSLSRLPVSRWGRCRRLDD